MGISANKLTPKCTRVLKDFDQVELSVCFKYFFSNVLSDANDWPKADMFILSVWDLFTINFTTFNIALITTKSTGLS